MDFGFQCVAKFRNFLTILASLFEYRFCIDFSWIVHRLWDGIVIDFPLFLHTDIAPLPNLATLVFEQHYGVLRSKSSFYNPRKSCLFITFTAFLAISFCIDFW
jgi:hypothetical protein